MLNQSEEEEEEQENSRDSVKIVSTRIGCICQPHLKCDEFMQKYIDVLFDPNATVSPVSEIKETFNQLTQRPCGRKAFSKHLTVKRVHHMNVCETTYLQLLANFVTILHLCNEDDDIPSAKILMMLAFTFHTDGHYLYEDLKKHPIWSSSRFWNAAFLHAVHAERKLRIVSDKSFSEQTLEQRTEFGEVHKNIFFGQLTSFLTNMKSLELPKEMIESFRDKVLVFQELDPEQKDILKGLTEGYYITRSSDADLSPNSLDALKSFGRSIFESISRTLS